VSVISDYYCEHELRDDEIKQIKKIRRNSVLFRCQWRESDDSRPWIDFHIFRPIRRFRRWSEQRAATVGTSTRAQYSRGEAPYRSLCSDHNCSFISIVERWLYFYFRFHEITRLNLQKDTIENFIAVAKHCVMWCKIAEFIFGLN